MPRLGVPSWIKIVCIAFCVLALLALLVSSIGGYFLGRQQAWDLLDVRITEQKRRLDQTLNEGDWTGALQAAETLDAIGALNDEGQRRLGELRNTVKQVQGQTAIPVVEDGAAPVAETEHERWRQARQAYALGSWEEALGHLYALRAEDPEHVDLDFVELMEDAYVQWARDLIQAEKGEEALVKLEVALALRGSERIQAEMDAANWMHDSLSYWDVDFERVLLLLEKVYRYDPDYANITERLREAMRLYHEYYSFRGEQCHAWLFLDELGTLPAELDQENLKTDLHTECGRSTA